MEFEFRKMWNMAFLYIGAGWFVLVWMIWSSGQLETMGDRVFFLLVVVPGFIAVYGSGFLIERWHLKKQARQKSGDGL